MSKVLVELQDNYRELRKIIFKKNLSERTFVITKIQACFYTGEYKKCISICSKWISMFPFDADLQIVYKAKSLLALGRKNDGYAMIELLLSKNTDVVSQRDFFYPLLSDSVAYGILLKKVSNEKIEEMKGISESENLQEKALLASNAELKKYFASKGR
ncbi:MAG: hypothetical protein ACXWE9_02645 [Methylobacter sp.]